LNDEKLKHFVNSTWPRAMSLRQCGKKSNHGLNYDEGFRGFAMINEMDEREAKRIYDLYHSIYPGIKQWYEAIKYELQKDRTLTNCFGRAVRFLGGWNDKLWKAAYSMKPQSTVVDSVNEGMVRIYEDEWLTKALNGDILAQVHDSILTQFPIMWLEDKRIFDMVLAKITYYTSPTLTANGKSYKIASDYKVGLNWGGAHKERNPQGMVEISSHEEFMAALKEWKNGSGTQGVDSKLH
jgi:DNA polymerase I-like protein with 3'-5' exonuclease and polymerase domains